MGFNSGFKGLMATTCNSPAQSSFLSQHIIHVPKQGSGHAASTLSNYCITYGTYMATKLLLCVTWCHVLW